MMHRLEFQAMGCRMLAIVDCDEYPAALQEVPLWFEEWEQVLSRFRLDSELSRLNRNAGTPVTVGEILWEVFDASLEAEKQTAGLVNPLILDALVEAGYGETFKSLSFETSTDASYFPMIVPSVNDIVSDKASGTICLPSGGHLDFGGIAKGWCAQQAAARLQAVGPALVSAGGDIAVSGPPSDGSEWEIIVDDPLQPGGDLDTFYISRGGVATSGKDRRRWMRHGKLQHHIIDPRTASPAETDVLTATVIAPTAVQAEAAAKAILISGSQVGLDWLEAAHDLDALLVLEHGQRIYSRNFEKYQ